MIPRTAHRAPRTRVIRSTGHQPRLESLAAEFALLVQRRTRAMHQLALLDQQYLSAERAIGKLQSRIAWLMQRMDALHPELRDPDNAAEAPEPVPPPPAAPVVNQRLAAMGRRWAEAQASPALRSRSTRRL